MKKTLLVLLTIVMSLGTLFLTACSQGDVSPENATEGLEYILNDTGKEYILASIGNASATDIVIASKYNGINVTAIAPDAFSGCAEITSVSVPASVKKIGSGAFAGCTSLKSVSIPEKSQLSEIGSGAFYNCTSLESIFIPTKVRTIEALTFYNCKSLNDVDMSEVDEKGNLTTIGDKAFYGCESLSFLVIPKKVNSIGASVLEGCNSLYSLEIPFIGANKEEGGNTHFGYLFGAANNSTVPSSLKKICITRADSIGAATFSGCVNIVSVEFAEKSGVAIIGHSAFKGCTGLTYMEVPTSVTNIGAKAFEGCSNLESIVLPFVGASKEEARNYYLGYVFGASNYLENAEYIPASLSDVEITSAKTISTNAFYGCAGLKTITIGSDTQSIGSGAFTGCTTLEKLVLPFVGASRTDRAYNFFGYVFAGRAFSENERVVPEALKTVEITDVDKIAAYAFAGCTSLENIKLSKKVNRIGKNAFTDTAFYNIADNWDNGVLYINDILVTAKDDFNGDCVIKDGTTYIAEAAFENCEGLTSVVISADVKYIDVLAFAGCTNLTSATFENTESGWKAGNADISNIGDAAVAAQYLRETYATVYLHFSAN